LPGAVAVVQVLVAASKFPSGRVPGVGQVVEGSMSTWSTIASSMAAFGQATRLDGRTTMSKLPA